MKFLLVDLVGKGERSNGSFTNQAESKLEHLSWTNYVWLNTARKMRVSESRLITQLEN